MTGPVTHDLDITLLKSGERHRFAIETRGASEWAVTIEMLAPVLRTSTFVLTSSDAILKQRAFMIGEAKAMMAQGWDVVMVPRDALTVHHEEPPPS
jgi:hypothetical protein